MLLVKLLGLGAIQESGIASVAEQCVDIMRDSSGEGDSLDCN